MNNKTKFEIFILSTMIPTHQTYFHPELSKTTLNHDKKAFYREFSFCAERYIHAQSYLPPILYEEELNNESFLNIYKLDLWPHLEWVLRWSKSDLSFQKMYFRSIKKDKIKTSSDIKPNFTCLDEFSKFKIETIDEWDGWLHARLSKNDLAFEGEFSNRLLQWTGTPLTFA